jgi:hypothetical protein
MSAAFPGSVTGLNASALTSALHLVQGKLQFVQTDGIDTHRRAILP